MNVSLAYCPSDEDQALRWFEWCRELGVGAKHHLTVLPFKGLTAPDIKGWASVTVLRDYSGVTSDWREQGLWRDASGPNFTFREMARHFYDKQLGRWLWMEPDAIPLTADAFDQIEQEDLRAGKRFMGARVQAAETPEHMSGIAVYPGDLAITGPNYMNPRMVRLANGSMVEAAFNLAGAPDALPDFHATRLIQQEYRHPAFTDPIAGRALIENGRVLFHSDKAGSLISILRNGKAGDEPCAQPTANVTRPPHQETAKATFATSAGASNGAAPSDPVPAPDIAFMANQIANLQKSHTALAQKVEDIILTTSDAKIKQMLRLSNGRKRRKLAPRKKRTAAEQAKINERMAKLRARKVKA